MLPVPTQGEQSFIVTIGTRSFDPKEIANGGGQAATAMIVQFTATLTTPDVDRLREQYGLRLNQYVPELAFLERVEPQIIGPLRADFLVRAAVALDPELKLSPAIASGGGTEFSATLLNGEDPGAVEAVLTAIAARDVRLLDDREAGGAAQFVFVLDDPARLPQVAELPDVVWIDRVLMISFLNAGAAATIQSGSAARSTIWDRGLCGKGQVIGIMDDGPIDFKHCFFADDAPNVPGPRHRKVLSQRGAVARDGTIRPVTHHATVTASVAAGDERGNSGKHPFRGGAWEAKLACGTFDDLLAVGIYRELDRARMDGAVIHSNSWCEDDTAPGSYSWRARAFDRFTWDNEDHLVVGSDDHAFDVVGEPPTLVPGTVGAPGAAKNALCVAAAKADPEQMTLGDGAFGPTADGRRKPDLVVVGCGINAAQENTPCQTTPLPCATSLAAPNAAAAAALARQYFMEGWYPTGEQDESHSIMPTGALLKAVLLNSTVDMSGESSYPNEFEGWGLVRLDRTLYFSGAKRRMFMTDVRHLNGLRHGGRARHTVTVGARTEQLKITLVWTDAPPAPPAFAKPVVNNLDLKVTRPDKTKYVGNAITNGVSTPNPSAPPDPINNVEMVIVDNPSPGKWVIEVDGDIKMGNPGQGYALVVTGELIQSRWR